MATSRFRGRLLAASVLTGCSLLLAACGDGDSLSRTFGFTRDTPDEFTVTTRAPLSMPPDFALRPPRPGAPRPMEQSESRQAETALLPQTALSAGQGAESAGQEALLQQAGPPVTNAIRAKIDADARIEQANNSFVDRLLFWQRSSPQGIVVDPQKEAQRLRENAALGESPETGDTPIIQPRKKGWLEGLF
jgi:hypothetical protein